MFYKNIGVDTPLKQNGTRIFSGSNKPEIMARVFKTSRKISLDNLRKLIDQYIDQTIRIKGFVLLNNNSIVSVQTVFDRIDIKPVDDKTSNTALILMGEEFNLSKFNKDFRQLME